MASGRGFAIDHAGASIAGRVRETNDDAWTVVERASLFVVADGDGQRDAADITVSSFRRITAGDAPENIYVPRAMDLLAVAAYEANARLRATAIGTGRPSYASCAALRFDDEWIAALSVGDCAVMRYRLGFGKNTHGADERGGMLVRISTLDELWLDLVHGGDTLAAATDLFEKTGRVVSRVLGTNEEISIEVCYDRLIPGDLFLLCSNGLLNQLSHREVVAIVGDTTRPLDARCDALVEAADTAAPNDNVTAVLIEVAR